MSEFEKCPKCGIEGNLEGHHCNRILKSIFVKSDWTPAKVMPEDKDKRIAELESALRACFDILDSKVFCRKYKEHRATIESVLEERE